MTSTAHVDILKLRRWVVWIVILLAVGTALRSVVAGDGETKDEPWRFLSGGALLVAAGVDSSERVLWVIDTGGPRRLLSGVRLSSITADDRELIVSGVGPGSGGGDRLYRLRSGRFVPAGAGTPEMGEHSPRIRPGGSVVYTTSTPDGRNAVRIWDVETGRDAAIYAVDAHLGVAGWGPGRRIGLFEGGPRERGRLLVLSVDGKVETVVRPKGLGTGAVHWGSGGFIALGRGRITGRGVTVSTSIMEGDTGNEVAEIADWKPMSWSPDGQRLLLLRDGAMGVVDAPLFSEVTPIEFPIPRYVSAGTWVPRIPEALDAVMRRR